VSEQIKDGGPAFPCEQHETQEGNWNQSFESGMTLRDYFAAKAMQGHCANISRTPTTTTELAESAYMLADSMLAAREAKS